MIVVRGPPGCGRRRLAGRLATRSRELDLVDAVTHVHHDEARAIGDPIPEHAQGQGDAATLAIRHATLAVAAAHAAAHGATADSHRARTQTATYRRKRRASSATTAGPVPQQDPTRVAPADTHASASRPYRSGASSDGRQPMPSSAWPAFA